MYSLAYSPDGQCILSGSFDGTIKVWDAHTGKPIGEYLQGHSDAVQCLTFSPHGSRFLSASDDTTIREWDSMTLQTVAELLRGHTKGVRAVKYSPDGERSVNFIARVRSLCCTHTIILHRLCRHPGLIRHRVLVYRRVRLLVVPAFDVCYGLALQLVTVARVPVGLCGSCQ